MNSMLSANTSQLISNYKRTWSGQWWVRKNEYIKGTVVSGYWWALVVVSILENCNNSLCIAVFWNKTECVGSGGKRWWMPSSSFRMKNVEKSKQNGWFNFSSLFYWRIKFARSCWVLFSQKHNSEGNGIQMSSHPRDI